MNRTPPGLFARLAIALAGAASAMIAAAVVLAIVNIYLSGHSLPTLDRPWIDAPNLGVRMTRSDVLLVLMTLAGGTLGWIASARPKRDG